MSVYEKYFIEKKAVIELAKSFNKMRKKLEKDNMSYEEFNSYYEKYFEAVINNSLGFDYVTYGSVLLNANVNAKSEEEKIKYTKQKLTLSKYLATYVIKFEMDKSINPVEVYKKVNAK